VPQEKAVETFYRAVEVEKPWPIPVIFSGTIMALPSTPHHGVLKVEPGTPAKLFTLDIYTYELRETPGGRARRRESLPTVELRKHFLGFIRFVLTSQGSPRAFIEEFRTDWHHMRPSELWSLFEEHVLIEELGVCEVYVRKAGCDVSPGVLYEFGYRTSGSSSWIMRKELSKSGRRRRAGKPASPETPGPSKA